MPIDTNKGRASSCSSFASRSFSSFVAILANKDQADSVCNCKFNKLGISLW